MKRVKFKKKFYGKDAKAYNQGPARTWRRKANHATKKLADAAMVGR